MLRVLYFAAIRHERLCGLLPITRSGYVYPRQPFQHRGTAAASARRSRCSASLS